MNTDVGQVTCYNVHPACIGNSEEDMGGCGFALFFHLKAFHAATDLVVSGASSST